jgi:hypothetical protein
MTPETVTTITLLVTVWVAKIIAIFVFMTLHRRYVHHKICQVFADAPTCDLPAWPAA